MTEHLSATAIHPGGRHPRPSRAGPLHVKPFAAGEWWVCGQVLRCTVRVRWKARPGTVEIERVDGWMQDRNRHVVRATLGGPSRRVVA